MIVLATSSNYRFRAAGAIEFLLADHGFEYEWIHYDDCPLSHIHERIASADSVILQNNNDGEIHKHVRYKNCLFVDSSPFRSYTFLYDMEGWGKHSRICKQTNWRKPLTKMGRRGLDSFMKDHGVARSGPAEDGHEVYVPARCLIDTQRSIDLFEKHDIRFDQVLTDSSFPIETRKVAENFASNIGAEYIHSKSNGIRLRNCKKIASDHIETTILAILQGIIPFSFAPSIISGSHACHEYMGDIGFYRESVPISQDHADSVVYRLLTELVPANATPEDLVTNPTVYEFLSVAAEKKEDAQSL
tara:strand:+ start:3948 stop:4853 length:906 start_codon:yes stop_codon:yes gene_type:complete